MGCSLKNASHFEARKTFIIMSVAIMFLSSCATSYQYESLGTRPLYFVSQTALKESRSIAVHILSRKELTIGAQVPGEDVDYGKTILKGMRFGVIGLLFFGPEKTASDPTYPDKIKKIVDSFQESRFDVFLLEALKEKLAFPPDSKVTFDIVYMDDLKDGKIPSMNSGDVHVNCMVFNAVFGPEQGGWSEAKALLMTQLLVFVITDEKTQYLFLSSVNQNENKILPYFCNKKLLSGQYFDVISTYSKYFRKSEWLADDGSFFKENLRAAMSDVAEKTNLSLEGLYKETKVRFKCNSL